jgi:hypothetical protein
LYFPGICKENEAHFRVTYLQPLPWWGGVGSRLKAECLCKR